MSKSIKTAVVTAALLEQVKAVLEDKAHNKYSTSKIYAAHNAVFNLNETPESCASCLRKRADALVKWYGEYATSTDGKDKKTIDQLPKQLGDAAHQGAPIKETFMIIDGERFTVVDDETEQPATVIFTPASEGANHGIATDVKGKPAPAYVYEQDGKAYLVSGEEGAYTEVTGEPIAEVKDFDLMDVTNKKGDTLKIKFVSEDGEAGIATLADGKALAAGTYTTKDGDTVAVQPGGKATLKSNLL